MTDFYFGEGFAEDVVEESIDFSDQVLTEDKALVEFSGAFARSS